MNEEVVGRHAGLPRVDAFSPGNTLCGSFDVRIRGDNARAFTSQLECDIGEVLCGGMHDLFANSWTSGEEDFVEMNIQDPVVHFAASRKAAHQMLVENFFAQFLEEGACRLRST